MLTALRATFGAGIGAVRQGLVLFATAVASGGRDARPGLPAWKTGPARRVHKAIRAIQRNSIGVAYLSASRLAGQCKPPGKPSATRGFPASRMPPFAPGGPTPLQLPIGWTVARQR